MALGKQQELIWQGRLHVGDEPGTFGDAAYCGLSCEFPLTIRRSGATKFSQPQLRIEATDVRVYPGYSGHIVSVTQYLEVPNTSPPKWTNELIITETMRGNLLVLKLPLPASAKDYVTYVSVKIGVATDAAPGLYDEFVVTKLSFESDHFAHYAQLGF